MKPLAGLASPFKTKDTLEWYLLLGWHSESGNFGQISQVVSHVATSRKGILISHLEY